MAIIYEVTLKVASTIVQSYLSWLHDHIREMLSQEAFISANLYEDISDKVEFTQCKEFSYIVQYTVASEEALAHYLQTSAPRMRQQGLALFGDNFKAHRRILKPISGENA